MAASGERLLALASALNDFSVRSLKDAAIYLLDELGYRGDKSAVFSSHPQEFWKEVNVRADLGKSDLALLSDWVSVQFLFQLTNDEIPSLALGQSALISGENSYQKGMIDSFVFICIELRDLDDKGNPWSRSKLSQITRVVNKAFPMPAILLFKYSAQLSLAVIDRRVNKRDSFKDVIDNRRISVIKDVSLDNPHRAHLEILNDFSLRELDAKHTPTNFRDLYEAWFRVLNVKELNKKFYDELYDWYWWSIKECKFPKGQIWEKDEKKQTDQKSVAVIRLLTRLIFVWFIKEKGLVPEGLFRREKLAELLKLDPCLPASKGESNYYMAVLQNLFFATLNTEQGETRKWRTTTNGYSTQHMVHTSFRYENLFDDPNQALEIFRAIPFLNGGLFECLDKAVTEKELSRDPGLKQRIDNNGNLRIDGFSDRADNSIRIPNMLFFAHEEPFDFGENARNKQANKANGLIDIFERYKFTIEENTPIEEEVALDPELLGKVFENLLASYNEDTKATARKQSGSFYTPREVVDYMVDETLILHFERTVGESEGVEEKLRDLLSFGSKTHRFASSEVDDLIESIERLKVLDPACGSGAFPMGMLQKLVHILGKLDPENEKWRAQNRAPLERQLKEAESIPDPSLRETKCEEAEEELGKVDTAFSNKHYADYSRKLYLIEKCLFGADIQPIAVQIAKLRFFISLAVDQRFDPSQPNGNITPLPNLETKLVAANTLIPIDRPIQGALRDGRIDVKENELRVANERHFAARTSRTKRKYRVRIGELRDELAEILRGENQLTKESAKQVVSWDPFDQNARAEFFDPEWMFGLDPDQGFDIVIGNPPYVRQEAINKSFGTGKSGVEPKKLLEKYYAPEKKSGRDARAVIGDVYSGSADLFVYFYARSFHVLSPGGAFSFITSNKWYRSGYGEKLRLWLTQNAQIRQLIDFGDEAVFTAIAYPTIIVATKRLAPLKQPAATETVKALNWKSGTQVETFATVFREEGFEMPQADLGLASWQIDHPHKRELLTRILATGLPLGAWCEGRLYRGILTGLNEAFVVDGSTRNSLVAADPKSSELLKPFLRGRDIKRWNVDFADQWLLMIESSQNKTHPWSGQLLPVAEKTLKQAYPAIHARMTSPEFKNSLVNRQDQGSYYWELRACAYWDEFLKPKIVIPAIAARPECAVELNGLISNNKSTIAVTSESHFACACINAPVNEWLTAQLFATKQGGFFDFEPRYSSQLRIPSATVHQKQVVRAVTELIISGTQHMSMWTHLLNGLVYELFFPEELKSRSISLFDEMWILRLQRQGEINPDRHTHFLVESQRLGNEIFKNDHAVYRMLFELQSIPLVRIIEGKEEV